MTSRLLFSVDSASPIAMSHQVAASLTGVLILAAAIWVGGFVAIAVITRAARSTLSPASQVRFFRAVGGSYGRVSSAALVVALAVGATLLSGRSWSGWLVATIVTAAVLVAATAGGVIQARRLGRMRQRALSDPRDSVLSQRVHRAARNAAALRALIGALSLALLALGMLLGS